MAERNIYDILRLVHNNGDVRYVHGKSMQLPPDPQQPATAAQLEPILRHLRKTPDIFKPPQRS